MITSDADDVLAFEFNGHDEQVRKYEHFSALMSATWRCAGSAPSTSTATVTRSSRESVGAPIPASRRTPAECYGNPLKFARGHMTRREDPRLGPPAPRLRVVTLTDARHECRATDAAVQRWESRCSPVPSSTTTTQRCLGSRSRWSFGRSSPSSTTRRASCAPPAIRYRSATFLARKSRIRAHETAQRSIISVERRAGLSFGPLAELDPFEQPEGSLHTSPT
jgi:endonuclease G, mitochondrial